MNRPAHDWFILQELEDEQEEEQELERWWIQQDQDQEFISHTIGD